MLTLCYMIVNNNNLVITIYLVKLSVFFITKRLYESDLEQHKHLFETLQTLVAQKH